jgi:hypothetical protein
MLIILLCLTVSLSARHIGHITLPYNHTTKTVQFFDQHGQPLTLHLSFSSKELLLHESVKNMSVFLDKHRKYRVDTGKVKYEYKIRQGFRQHEEGVVGSVGIGQGGELYSLVKKALNSTGVKLEVRSREQSIRAVGQNCLYPIFLPLMITLSETNTHSYPISKMSTEFAPDSSFLTVINQQKSPFSLGKQQLSTDVTVSVRDQIISVPFSALLRCGKYANSVDNYECEVNERPEADVGGLLFDFDPVFCDVGLELDRKN